MTTIKNTREYFLSIYNKLGNLGDLRGAKFSYTITKIKDAIEPQLKKVREMAVMSEEYKEFDKKRIELNESHAKKDKKGEIETKDGRYVIADQAKFDKEVESLKKKYDKAIKEREQQAKDVEAFLKEEITLKLRTLPLAVVPDTITPDEMEIIKDIIVD